MKKSEIIVRQTRREDFSEIIKLCEKIYPKDIPWTEKELALHLEIFPEGQLVAVETATNEIVGMSASLIILWDDYEMEESWHDFTDGGKFTNHDAENGRTLYGAEVMVAPDRRGKGIGKKIYLARRELVENLGLLRIRAGARLRNYHRYASEFSAEEYVRKVIKGEIGDPTLSFQLRQNFKVIAVVSGYLENDAESLGKAAIIEWINKKVAKDEDYTKRRASAIC